MYWFFIVLGIIILSFSLSNPVYNLIFKKKIKLNLLFNISLRIVFFILAIITIFFGLYLESIY